MNYAAKCIFSIRLTIVTVMLFESTVELPKMGSVQETLESCPGMSQDLVFLATRW